MPALHAAAAMPGRGRGVGGPVHGGGAGPVHGGGARPAPRDASRNKVCRSGVSRALGDRDAAGQVRQYGAGVVIFARDGVRRGAGVVLIGCVEDVGEHWAIFDDAGLGRALIHCVGKHGFVPTVHKVAVQSITGRVAVGEDEASAVVQIVEGLHAEPHLVE